MPVGEASLLRHSGFNLCVDVSSREGVAVPVLLVRGDQASLITVNGTGKQKVTG